VSVPVEAIRPLCPGVDERLVREHLGRLGERYFAAFSHLEIAGHLNAMARLSRKCPVELILEFHEGGAARCTVLAFDYAFEFSLISGVLAGLGFDILSGNVFTYTRHPEEPPPARRRRRPAVMGAPPSGADAGAAREAEPLIRRRRIIDDFTGELKTGLSPDAWSEELRRRLGEVIGLLEQGRRPDMEKAKRLVTELVTRRLAGLPPASTIRFLPVEIEIDNESVPFTRMRVVGQDTPAFLYTLSSVLSQHGFSIEQISIRTTGGVVEDEIDFVDAQGRKVVDEEEVSKVRLSVLLTKQFTYYLERAPDPYAAFLRFEQLVDDLPRLPDKERWLNALSNPLNLRDLARLLGASDFLWEDFIRSQYESLLPILGPHVADRRFSEPKETIPERLRRAIEPASSLAALSFEEKRLRLNQFKDREIFLIDLDHILGRKGHFRDLAEHLTALAESVVGTAAGLVYDSLRQSHGRPRTVAGLEAAWAILGLGKLGGAALGYASDIELLFVYSDRGRTDGRDPIDNTEFFERLVRETAQFIDAKREGIFSVDLRLRPYGQKGSLASSLDGFCRYYGPGGPAEAFERLSLVRLRAIGGDAALGAQVERLRDEFIYRGTASIDLGELRAARHKQMAQKERPGEYNAKFSPGALVDLESAVQVLQLLHGEKVAVLRTPRIHHALKGLEESGILSPGEFGQIEAAYDFLRRLINGLRMLRGSAQDLFLPPVESPEYLHLARRMGYEGTDAVEPAQKLHVEFETRTAAVRSFVERHFGRESLPGPPVGNVADLVLSETIPGSLRERILAAAGFVDAGRAYTNLKALAGEKSRRELFASLAVLACDILRHEPDPDMALNNWERFQRSLPGSEVHYELFLAQPKRLEILLGIFSRSQFLANTLIHQPDLLEWVTAPENLGRMRTACELEGELRSLSHRTPDPSGWLNLLRRLRRREILRIGTKDLCLKASPSEVFADLSTLACACIQVSLERIWMEILLEERAHATPIDAGGPERFCILAFGKLGGSELNYSSDIDLLALYDDRGLERQPADRGHRLSIVCTRAMERLAYALSAHTEEGHAYRVDLRLRPHGGVGELVPSLSRAAAYYVSEASPWEAQAALKLRPVAGSRSLGEEFLRRIRPIFLRERDREAIVRAIHDLRMADIKREALKSATTINVKRGEGGLRDIEFMVQGLQLIHAPRKPEVLGGNTLAGLGALGTAGVLPGGEVARLSEDYVFLRRVEHYLQILEDRQTHSVPESPREQEILAKRLLGNQAGGREFMKKLEACLERVRAAYRTHLLSSP